MWDSNPRSKTSRRKYVAAIGATISAGLAGCSSGGSGESTTESDDGGGEQTTEQEMTTAGSTTTSGSEQLTFGLALNDNSGIFKRVMGATTEIYANEAHDIDVITTGAGFDSAQQIDQVRNMLNQGIDGLLLNPASSDALVGVAEEAADQGVPVYTIDVTSPTDAVNMFVGFGSVRGGRRSGERLISAMQERGATKIYEIMGDPAVETISLRSEGFRQAVDEADGIEVVGSGPGGFSREETVTALNSFIQTEEIHGIFSTWGGGGLAAVTALEQNDMLNTRDEDGHVPIVPIDGFPDVLQNIRDGFITSALQQPMPYYGPIAIEYLLQHLEEGGYQGPSPGDTVESGDLDIQNVESGGATPFAEDYWAPAEVESWESEGTEYFPWMTPRSPMITPDIADAGYLWGNYADDIL